MFKPIEQLVVPVVDAFTGLQVSVPRPNSKGERDYKERIYRVSPLRQLWPDVKVVILDWTTAFEAVERTLTDEIAEAKRKNQKPPNFNEEKHRRMLELLKSPVEFEGTEYYGWYGWGSAVKHLQTLGLDRDIGTEAGLLAAAEDGSRYLRAFLPSSLYGGGHLSEARVLVVPDRTEYKGYLLADGFGLIKQSLAERMRRPDSVPIKLGRGRQNYLGWQRFRWDKIKDEATPLILDNLETVGSPNWVLEKLDADAGGYKNRLIEIEPEMVNHPYCKLSANVSVKRLMQELGTTVPLPTYVRIAVPTKVEPLVWDGDPKLICARHPMDSWVSQLAHQVDPSTSEYQEALELIRNMIVYQVTETSYETTAKGLRAAVPDEIMGEYDLIITVEDLKMLKGKSVVEYRDSINESGTWEVLVIKDLVIAFTQLYDAGCVCGVDPETWKSQGGDFDGDMAFLTPCSNFPAIWEEARTWYGLDHSWKIKKVSSPPDERPDMLIDVMGSGVGFATNVVSTTFTRQPDDRLPIAEALYAAGVTLKPTVKRLDMWCNKVIKVMTDGFKSRVNMTIEKLMLRKAQQAIATACGGTASWAVWSQESSPAFINGLPLFYDMLTRSTLRWIAEDKNNRRQAKIRMHIPQQQYEATCAQIYRLVLPWIQQQYREGVEVKGVTYSFLELIETNPGSMYIGWAPHVNDTAMNRGMEMVREFAGRARQVIWVSSEDTTNFKETWQEMCEIWAKKFSSREEAAYVLWRASHHASVSGNGAAAIFMGFPDLAMSIVEDKPGLREQQEEGVRALLAGVSYNFMAGTMPDSVGPVTCRVIEHIWRGDLRRVVVLDELIPGMVPQEHFPIGMFGMVTVEPRNSGRYYTVPECGAYIGRFTMNKSGKSFRAFLNPVSEELPDGVTLS